MGVIRVVIYKCMMEVKSLLVNVGHYEGIIPHTVLSHNSMTQSRNIPNNENCGYCI